MRLPRSARLALRALETTIGPWQPVCRRGAARGGARGSLGSRMDPAERRGGPQPCSGGGRGRYRAKAVQMRLPTCHFVKKRKIVFNEADFSLCLGVTFVWGTLTFVKNILPPRRGVRDTDCSFHEGLGHHALAPWIPYLLCQKGARFVRSPIHIVV